MKTLEPPARLATAFKDDPRIERFDCEHIEGSLYRVIIHFRNVPETIKVLVDFDALVKFSERVEDLKSGAHPLPETWTDIPF